MILHGGSHVLHNSYTRRCVNRAYKVGAHCVYNRHSTLCNIPSVEKKKRNEVQIGKYRTQWYNTITISSKDTHTCNGDLCSYGDSDHSSHITDNNMRLHQLAECD